MIGASMFIGNRYGDFSYTISGNWQRGSQQPLTYTTTPALYPRLLCHEPTSTGRNYGECAGLGRQSE